MGCLVSSLYQRRKVGQVDRCSSRSIAHFEPHDGSGVWCKPFDGAWCSTGVCHVIVAGEVVQAGIKSWQWSCCIVVHDDLAASRNAGEVNNHIGTLRWTNPKGVCRVVQYNNGATHILISKRCTWDNNRGWKEASFGSDLNPSRTCIRRIWNATNTVIPRPCIRPSTIRKACAYRAIRV